eukprot:762026-Hanusia_phi.AAC.4
MPGNGGITENLPSSLLLKPRAGLIGLSLGLSEVCGGRSALPSEVGAAARPGPAIILSLGSDIGSPLAGPDRPVRRGAARGGSARARPRLPGEPQAEYDRRCPSTVAETVRVN